MTFDDLPSYSSLSSPVMLPLEIVELIIDLLARDGHLDALRNCCLTSPQLVHMCRKHIFSTIKAVQERIYSDDYDSDEEVEELCPNIPHPIERFGRLLESNPHISSYVRNLEIGSMLDYNHSFIALQHLYRVTNFTFGFSDSNRLDGWTRDWGTVSSSIDDSLQSFIQQNTITTLYLFNIRDLPIHILLGLRFLQHLSVLFATVEIFQDASLSWTVPLVNLKTLDLQTRSLRFAEAAMLSSNIFGISALDQLSVQFAWFEDTEILHRILALPQSLASLYVFMEGMCIHPLVLFLPPHVTLTDIPCSQF